MMPTESLMAQELLSWPSCGKVSQPPQEDSAQRPEPFQSCMVLYSRAISMQPPAPAAFLPHWLVSRGHSHALCAKPRWSGGNA